MRKPSHYLSFLLIWISLSFNALPSFATTSATTDSTQALEPVSLQLKWKHQFQFAGYYAAKIKGFYEDEGLDVTIKERDIFRNNIEQVINGESEYGIADSMLMLYQAKGAPLKIIAPIFQHSPQVFAALKSSGINSPFDMEDKKIAFYQKDTDGFPLLAMLHENNIKVEFTRQFINSAVETLTSGQADAYPIYLSNEPYYFSQEGLDINIINPVNFGIDFYGDLIFAHNDELKNHPKRVEAFRKASIKGWKYALENKDEMITYIINELGANKTYKHLAYEAKVIEDAIKPNSVAIGTLNIGRLEYIQRLFKKHKLIDTKLNLQQGIYQPEKHQFKLTAQEQEWIRFHPEVKVAIHKNWSPLEFVNENGDYAGIIKEYLEYISNQTGIKFAPQFHLEHDEAIQKLKEGEIALLSTVITNNQLNGYVSYTPEYLNLDMVIATQKGENYIAHPSKLKNKIITVKKGHAASSLLKKYPNLNVLLVNSVEDGLKAVANGNAYAYIDSLAAINFNIHKLALTNIQVSGEIDLNIKFKMAIHKDKPELHSIITKALNSMDKETQIRLNQTWLQIDYKTGLDMKQLLIYLTPVFIFILAVLFYGQKMRKLNLKLMGTNKALIDTQKSLEANKEKLEIISVTDFLTGAYNRQHIDQVLNSEINRSKRYKTTFSVLLIDLDNFKDVNDNFGHLAGDEALKAQFKSINDQVRKIDTVGRWGGEEFIVICPETNLDQAVTIAQKIIDQPVYLSFDKTNQQTVSIGVAEFQERDTANTLIDRADKSLYKAKKEGKNQVNF